MSYLEVFLVEVYGAHLETFDPAVLDIAFEPMWGVIYSPRITFSEYFNDFEVPSLDEVNSMVQSAFTDRAASELVAWLVNDSEPNVFRTTGTVIYSMYQYVTTVPSVEYQDKTSPPPSPSPITLAPSNGVTISPTAPLPLYHLSSPSPSITLDVEPTTRVIAFIIEYKTSLLQNEGPDEQVYALTANITMVHLADFLAFEFSQTFGAPIKSFGSVLLDAYSDTLPTIIYEVRVTFSEASAFVPTTDEVNFVTELAFTT